MLYIGIMGDRINDFPPQTTIEPALEHAAERIGVEVDTSWVPSEEILRNPEVTLGKFDALFATPGAATNLDGAVAGIQYARTNNRVMVGTCGGFQHAVLEFAMNVVGLKQASHPDYDPDGKDQVLTALTCSIGGLSMPVRINPGSRAYAIFGTNQTVEEYYCNYGINPEFEEQLIENGLIISGRDEEGGPRILELPNHPFFVASLFVPQTRSTIEEPHPLLIAFLEAAIQESKARKG